MKRFLSPKAGARTRSLDAVLSKDEFIALLGAAKDAKDKATLCLLVIGLRASECGAARAEWVDFSAMTIRVPGEVAKRGKARVVPFRQISLVKEILTGFFLLEPVGIGLSRVAVWGRVKRMARAAGITHPVTPHGLRATGATWLAAAGWSITGLLDHFGWSELRTAQHYVRASGASAMRDMEDKGGRVL